MSVSSLYAIYVETRHGFKNPYDPYKPLPLPVQTRTRHNGYGFARVGVRVALGNPRVTRDNHYPEDPSVHVCSQNPGI